MGSNNIPTKQESWVLYQLGGTTADFKKEKIDTPVLINPLDILVKNIGISLNPTDFKARLSEKKRIEIPKVLGRDASGIVVQIGSGVKNLKIGDEVWYAGTLIRQGTYQQYTLVDYRIVSKKPKTLEHIKAASLPLTALTAWEGVYENFQLDNKNIKGKKILITAAAGGVGSIAVELCKYWGFHVTATASRSETVEWVKKLGADVVINHHESFIKQIGDQSQYFDYCLNTHDDTLLPEIVSVMKPRSQITCILEIVRGPELLAEMWKSAFFKRITFHFELMYSRTVHDYEQEKQGEILIEVAKLVDNGTIKHTVGKEWQWDQMIEAQNYLETGKSIGKNVVHVPQ